MDTCAELSYAIPTIRARIAAQGGKSTTMNARVQSSISIPRVAAIVTVGVIGAIVTIVMPGILAALIASRGLSVAQAAMITSVEMVGMAIATVTTAPLLATVDRRALLIAALAIAATGDLGAAGTSGYVSLLSFRFVAGFGEGALIASMSAAIAATGQPDRLFALFMTVNLLVSMGLLRAFPVLAKTWGAAGVYGALLLLTLAGVFCIPAFPRRAVAAPAAHGGIRGILKLLREPPVALGVFACLILFVGVGMVWPLMGQLGASYGMPLEKVDAALGNSALVGVFSGLFTFWLGTRVGRRVPLIVGSCGLLATTAALALSGAASWFDFATIVFMFSWVIATAYYLGTLAHVDVTGRAATLGLAMQQAGLVVGPALAAALVQGNRFHSALWSSCGTFALALITVSAADRLAVSYRQRTA
jgi:DHA1 family inner membrane transport protein